MKAFKFVVIGLFYIYSSTAQSQFSMSVSIDSPPMWGPAGYSAVRYYYLPDVEAYYDVRTSMFIYVGGGAWVHRAALPPRYKNYDLYKGYKVVMPDYYGKTPYSHFREHKSKYHKGYKGNPQRTIGDHPGKGNSGNHNASPGTHDKGDKENKDYGHGNGKHKK